MFSFWDTIVDWLDSCVVIVPAVKTMFNIAIFYVFYVNIRKLFW